jgi:cobalt-zinc-cadmium efflux system outer membrane protein
MAAWRCAGAIAAALLIAGCQSAPKLTDSEIAAPLGSLAGAIEFREIGGPIDVPASVGELTLADAVERALRADARLQQALSRVRIAQAEADQERLLPNPVLTVAVRLPEGGGSPTVEAALAAELLSLLQKPGKIRAADHRLRAAGAEVVVVALDLVNEVESRYLSVQSLEAAAATTEPRRAGITRLQDLASARLRAGEGTRIEVTALRAQQAALDAEVSERQVELAEERLALAKLIGQPSGEASWRIAPLDGDAVTLSPERDWIDAALIKRPEIQARQSELAARGEDLAASRWLALEGAEAGIDTEHEDAWEIGPAISTPIPIFDWGQAKRARLRAERIEARHALVETQRQVIQEVRRSYAAVAGLRAASERLRADLLPVLQQQLDEAESAYRAGQGGLAAVVQAEGELRDARARLIELTHKTAQAASRLRRAVGGSAVADAIHAPPASTQPDRNAQP